MKRMIIDSSNLMSTTSIKALETHLRYGAENDAVSMVQGSWRGLHVTVKGALENGQKFSFKHVILAPYEDTTRQQVMETIIPAVCKEFGINASKVTVVEHSKARADRQACCLHWHMLVPWYDAGKDRAHDFSFDFLRQSKVAQLAAFKLGHAFVLTRHHAEIIESLRKDGETACADALEAAFPIGARPDNAAVPLPVIQAAAAKGRDMIQTRSVIRFAERNTNTAAELTAELEKHGLFIVVGKLSPPAWVVIDSDGEVVGKLAGLAHCTLAKIIQRLGEPEHVYCPEPDTGADQRREDADRSGDPARLDILARAGDVGNDCTGVGPDQPAHDAASSEIFVAALNAPENELRVNKIFDRAMARAVGVVVIAQKFWDQIEEQTRAWLASLAVREMPATPVITGARHALAAVEDRLARAQADWGRLEGELIFMRLEPLPPRHSLDAHHKRVRSMEKKRDAAAVILNQAKAEAAQIRKQHEQFESHFAKQNLEYRKMEIEPRIGYGERILAVLDRCRALISAHPESLVFGALGLFRFGVAEAQKAPPTARWFVDVGPEDDDPDDIPDDGFNI